MRTRLKKDNSKARSLALRMLTRAEIERRFESEWVLVGSPRQDDQMRVRAGEVLFHSRDRDAVYRRAIQLRPKRFALLYTGTPPQDTAIVLCVRGLIRAKD